MPTDACLYFHECVACHAVLRPKPGDCCVFCSFGSVKCPPGSSFLAVLCSRSILRAMLSNPSLQPTCYGLRPPHAAELKR